MNYIKISKFDTANGNGIGCVLWVSGCEHCCPQCHNPHTWDFSCGKVFDDDAMQELLQSLDRPYISRLTFSGGDPLNPQNRDFIYEIAKNIKAVFPKISLWCYTGYDFEDVKSCEVIPYLDVLVDGKFDYTLKDVSLPFCGSRNQRVLDVQKTLKEGKVVLWE